MIIKTYEFKIDDVVDGIKQDVALKKYESASQFIYYSELKKDLLKNGCKEYFVKLDDLVYQLVKENNIKEGVVFCNSKHTTSSIFINHFEAGILSDLLDYFKAVYPSQKKYRHNEWDFEFKNADAHLKSIELGKGATVIVKNRELILEDFENIIYAEFDYRPLKSFSITILGEQSDNENVETDHF